MNHDTLQFLLTTLMVLATLLCVYLGARLYRLKRSYRMAIVLIPLVINIALYAIYRTTPFFYLSIILLISTPLAWARKSP